MKINRKVYIALPVLNESKVLHALIKCLGDQDTQNFELVVCVNNYNHWWNDPQKINQCIDNQNSLDYLKTVSTFPIKVIDRSSSGLGWPQKKGGVGWARKIAMDFVNSIAVEQDLIVCIDADTFYPPDFISSIVNAFDANPDVDGLAIPYYHKIGNPTTDRLILRYEIYMRYYLLNLMRIRSPYAFTALGSAMAVTVKAYRKTGGLTPVKSGEDFYFLQKIVKVAKLGLWANTVAYPSSRLSDRVLFGTGPALLKGQKGDWNSYPIYHQNSFNKVGITYDLFGKLFHNNLITPMDEFLAEVFKEENSWAALRQNYKDEKNFVNACIRKVDGLRILQFLRKQQENNLRSDEECLLDYLRQFHHNKTLQKFIENNHDFSFTNSSLEALIQLREILFEEEMRIRRSWGK
jgi:glycosyltransferase involved in cell wall biosynthesis